MASSGHRALSALFLALAFASGARADGEEPGDCARAVAERVQARYEGVRDLEARFTQKSRSVALGSGAAQEMQARGVALFAKPGRMRWTYEAPEPSVVVSDGETLWIYDPVAKEAQEFPVGQGFLSGTAVQFLLGEGRILEAFDVRAEGCGTKTVRLHLRPRVETSYESLELLVVPETGEIRESAVLDLFGNRTDVIFTSVRSNLKIDPAQFRFEPAPGVRVLRAGPPPGGSDSQ
jgi:outer membrane lipoprotein carrier protein